MGVVAVGPALGAFAQPCASKAQGELVEDHDAICAGPWPADGEPSAGPVEVGEVQAPKLHGTQRVDGDQRDRELRHGGGRPVEQAAEPVGRQRPRELAGTTDPDAAGRVAEDQALALERAEQRPQRGLHPVRARAGAALEGGLHVVCCDRPQAIDLGALTPLAQDRRGDGGGRVWDEQALGVQELGDALAGVARAQGGDRLYVDLVDRGGRAQPGQQQPKAAQVEGADRRRPRLGTGELVELVQELLRGAGEGRERGALDPAPVPSGGLEQHELIGVDQAWGDRPDRFPALRGSPLLGRAPALLVVVGAWLARPQLRGGAAAEPQLVALTARAPVRVVSGERVLGENQVAGPAAVVLEREVSPAAPAGADRMPVGPFPAAVADPLAIACPGQAAPRPSSPATSAIARATPAGQRWGGHGSAWRPRGGTPWAGAAAPADRAPVVGRCSGRRRAPAWKAGPGARGAAGRAAAAVAAGPAFGTAGRRRASPHPAATPADGRGVGGRGCTAQDRRSPTPGRWSGPPRCTDDIERRG